MKKYNLIDKDKFEELKQHLDLIAQEVNVCDIRQGNIIYHSSNCFLKEHKDKHREFEIKK